MGLKKKIRHACRGRYERVRARWRRGRDAFAYYHQPLGNLWRWIWDSREDTNYTYDLTADNTRYLAAMVAEVAGVSVARVEELIREIQEDAELREHVVKSIASHPRGATADTAVRYGRRVGWYALVRILKPRVVVETGVEKGLGSCVLTAALRRNAAEGAAGRYFGTDLDPTAGYLLCGPYAEHGRILYGDSLVSLRALEETIDLFINDSDHSADYETEEYGVVAGKLSPQGLILGDNAHVTDRLLRFSLKHGRGFLFFQEKPRDHWYPGAGIGFSFPRKASAV